MLPCLQLEPQEHSAGKVGSPLPMGFMPGFHMAGPRRSCSTSLGLILLLRIKLNTVGDRTAPQTGYQWGHFPSAIASSTVATVPASSSQPQLPLLIPSPSQRPLPHPITTPTIAPSLPYNCPFPPLPTTVPANPSPLALLPQLSTSQHSFAPDTNLTTPTLSSLGRLIGHSS